MEKKIELKGPVLVALRRTDPAAWREAVRAAIASTGILERAAAELGVTRRSLNRWLDQEPRLLDGLRRGLRGPGNPHDGE